MKKIFPSSSQKYSERAKQCKHPLAKRLLELMEQKKTNLALAADVATGHELIQLADRIGPYLCILKTHIDILNDFSSEIPRKLQQIANKHNFLIFEDRKFADIGNTVLQQYEGGIYQINKWAHLTNAHPLPGPGIIEGLQTGGLSRGNGLLLLAELSSKGSLIDEDYTKKTIDLALKYPDFVIGFICQQKLTDHPFLIHMTPGIQMVSKGDALGQQYHTPEDAIYEKGTDIVIVGRGIIQGADPEKAAIEYRQTAWSAYQRRCC